MTPELTAGDPGRASRIVLNVMRLSLAAFLFAVLTRTGADADLWGHLVFGRDIVHLRGIPAHDSYSFTSDIPWVNHEWLAEVIAYGSYAFGGSVGLVVVKSLLMLSMLAMVLVSLRQVATDPVVHDLLVFLVVSGTYGRSLTFRPQVFSLLLFPALLLTLLTAERGRGKALLAVPVIFVLWANLHGGWIVGLAAFGIWGAWTFLHADRYALSRTWLIATGIAAVLATLVNPYGPALWTFLGTTVRLSRDIADWQPLWKLPVAVLTPWITATALAAGAVFSERRRLNPSHVGIVALYWISSIRVSRLDAFFVVSVVMLLGPEIRAAFRKVLRPSTPPVSTQPSTGSIALAVVLIGVVGMLMNRGNFKCIAIEEAWAPEAEAVVFARSSELRGRMLTFFDWGEYAIWHLAPDIKVSMDGRRETVYSEELVARHFQLYQDKPGGLEFVDQLRPDYIWLPTRLAVVRKLESRGWRPVFSGPQSVILALNSDAVSVRPVPTAGVRPRCFPGP